MLKLPRKDLPQNALSKLSEYQQEIDVEATYPLKVKKAKALFPRRNTTRNATFRQVKTALKDMCAGAQRCAYCEDSVGDEVEHIKPKDIYPNDCFVWENYVYACGQCNIRKSNDFAVIHNGEFIKISRSRRDPVVEPVAGQAGFIDPRSENPMDFMELDLTGTLRFRPYYHASPMQKQRARFTIDVIELNRDVLTKARRSAYSSYIARLDQYIYKSTQNVSQQELDQLIENLLLSPWPAVWEEIKRKSDMIPDLREAFQKAPEAKNWSR